MYMVPIHPDRVGLFEAPSGEYFYYVTRNGLHEMAMLREQPLMIPAENMFHIRWLPMWNVKGAKVWAAPPVRPGCFAF
jgi:hypothetical protein